MVNRMFTINNNSELATKFEFFNQPGNVFSFSKTKGTVTAKSNTRIIVRPTNPVAPTTATL